jgi:hypothetical protein
MGECNNLSALPHSIMEVAMKKYFGVLVAIALVLVLTGSVLAASLGISPSSIEMEVPADGSATANFQVHYYIGDVKISLVDIPLTVEPETVYVDALAEPADIEVTVHGDPSLGSQVYDGYIRFLGMSGETISVAVKVKAKMINVVEGQAIPSKENSEENEAADKSLPATTQGGMDSLTRNIIIIFAALVICLGLIILTVSLARRR